MLWFRLKGRPATPSPSLFSQERCVSHEPTGKTVRPDRTVGRGRVHHLARDQQGGPSLLGALLGTRALLQTQRAPVFTCLIFHTDHPSHAPNRGTGHQLPGMGALRPDRPETEALLGLGCACTCVRESCTRDSVLREWPLHPSLCTRHYVCMCACACVCSWHVCTRECLCVPAACVHMCVAACMGCISLCCPVEGEDGVAAGLSWASGPPAGRRCWGAAGPLSRMSNVHCSLKGRSPHTLSRPRSKVRAGPGRTGRVGTRPLCVLGQLWPGGEADWTSCLAARFSYLSHHV